MTKLIMKLSGIKLITTTAVQEVTITENGTRVPDIGYVGFNPVNVNVQPPLQEKTVTQNGEVTPDEPNYGLLKVNVAVVPNLEEIVINENGVVFPSAGKDGISKVTVDTTTTKTWTPNPNWINIRQILSEDTYIPNNDIENSSFIISLCADTSYDTNSFRVYREEGLVAVRTSDGQFYKTPDGFVGLYMDFVHEWDRTKDYDTKDIFGYNQRWVILYYYSTIPANRLIDLNMHNLDCIYNIYKGVSRMTEYSNTNSLSTIMGNWSLVALDCFNDETDYLIHSTGFTRFFGSSNTVGLPNFEYFNENLIRRNLHETDLFGINLVPINTMTKIWELQDANSVNRIYNGCERFPIVSNEIIDLSRFTSINNISRLFQFSSITIISLLKLNNADGTTFNYPWGSSSFNTQNTTLKRIEGLNLYNAVLQQTQSLFVAGIQEVTFKEGKVININLNVSASTSLSKQSLLRIIEQLQNRTSMSSLNLVLGATNIAKLTLIELNQITAKNWTYA